MLNKYILHAIRLSIFFFILRSTISADVLEFKTGGQPDQDILLVRLDSKGQLVWRKDYSCKGINTCQAAIRTRDEKIVLLGYGRHSTEAASSFMLMVVDTGGFEDWTRYYKPVSSLWPIQCMDIAQLHDGRYVISGVSGHDSGEIWIVCISENGELLWSRSHVMPNDGSGHDCSLIPTMDGGFILAGSLSYRDRNAGVLSTDVDVHIDGWILKTDSAGNKLWLETYGSRNRDFFTDVVESSDGTLWAIGEKARADSALIQSDAWIIQANHEGRIVKEKLIASGYHTELRKITAVSDKAFILAGDIWDGNHNDPYLVKMDSEEDTLWSHRYCRSENIVIGSALSHSSGYLLAGHIFVDGIRLWDSYFMLVDSLGQQKLAWSYGCGKCSSFTDIIAVPGGYILAGDVVKSCPDSVWKMTPQ